MQALFLSRVPIPRANGVLAAVENLNRLSLGGVLVTSVGDMPSSTQSLCKMALFKGINAPENMIYIRFFVSDPTGRLFARWFMTLILSHSGLDIPRVGLQCRWRAAKET